jgi:hypothetical protein
MVEQQTLNLRVGSSILPRLKIVILKNCSDVTYCRALRSFHGGVRNAGLHSR